MFNWIASRFSSGNEDSGPLASARAVRELISELDAETPQYALKTLAERYKDTPRELLTTPNGANGLRQLDEWVQRAVNELWGSLLADNQGLSVSEAIWSSLAQYYRRAYSSYLNCVGAKDANGSSSKRDREHAMVSAARSIAAVARYVLLMRMRYFSLPDETWSHLYRLIGWASEQGRATEKIELYPGAGAKTTIEQEFLVTALIAVAPTPNLSPSQILALEHLLRLHVNHYRMAERYDARLSPFAFEPGRAAAPQQFLPGLKMRPDARFFGLGAANDELRKARDQAQFVRNLPEWLAQMRCGQEAYTDLLDRLLVHWSPEPPRRRHPREARDGEILVAHDLRNIRRLLKFSELAACGQSFGYDTGNVYKMKDTMRTFSESSLSDPHAAARVSPQQALANLATFEKSLEGSVAEMWKLNDVSESGLGATAETDCSWARVGMVIAYRHCESADWQVATIRRLCRSMHGSLSIGMARICSKVSAARLRLGAGAVDYTRTVGNSAPQIEYDGLVVRDSACSVLLPIGVFDRTQKYTLTCEDKQQVVKMEKSLERGPNFERIEISEVQVLRAA